MSKTVLDALNAKFGDKILASGSNHGDEYVTVDRSQLVAVATFLRDDPKMAFDAPVFVTCIDHLWDEVETTRFEVVFQLRSLAHRHRIRLSVLLKEDDAKLPTLTTLWVGFGWQERETFDMYGIVFEGHADLRRIYLYDEFVGYPLRKDYPKDKRQPLVRRDDLMG